MFFSTILSDFTNCITTVQRYLIDSPLLLVERPEAHLTPTFPDHTPRIRMAAPTRSIDPHSDMISLTLCANDAHIPKSVTDRSYIIIHIIYLF